MTVLPPVSKPLTGPIIDRTGVLDPTALSGLVQLDPTGANRLLPRVFNTYVVSLARLMEQLAQSRETGDHAGIRLAAHTLKSSSASVGALALSALCAEAEQAVREGRPDALPLVLDHLQAEAARVDSAVRQLLAD